MKKLIALGMALVAFLANNEILTLLIIGVGVVAVAVFVLKAWASKETAPLPGSFDADWGKK